MLGTQSKENVSLSRDEEGAPPLPFSVWQGDRQLAPHELPMQTATRTNQPVHEFQETIRRSDGTHVELVVNAVPLRDEAGNARGCVATFSDLTLLRAQEHERLELERRMLEAQRLEGLGVLAGGVAHDFNNLLTGIVGNASLARLDLDSTQQNAREALINVERASMRAAGLCKECSLTPARGGP
jgi:signal transduction histidine kinase